MKEGAARLGVVLGDEELSRFMAYLDELKAWNRKINLTSLFSEREIVLRHFLDSLTPYSVIKKSTSLLDIGSGAGFPGIPLKIVLPELRVVLMESTAKKVFFMRHVIRRLGLGRTIEALHARAEDRGVVERYRGRFECVISRALAGLPVFLRLARPYLKEGGLVVAMKGPGVVKELGSIREMEGFVFEGTREVSVPFTERRTVLVLFRGPDGHA